MDKMNMIDDIESEYKKLLIECKKKFHTTREVKKTHNTIGNRSKPQASRQSKNIKLPNDRDRVEKLNRASPAANNPRNSRN
jgi:hypothetical protein